MNFIPIGNTDLLSDSELQMLDSPFYFSVSLNADDPHDTTTLPFIFERVELDDIRYSLEMDTEGSSLYNLGSSKKANFEPHRVFYISRADVLYGAKGTTIFK